MPARKIRDYFVIMPFGPPSKDRQWKARFNRIIRSGVEKYEGRGKFECERIDMKKRAGSITEAFIRRLHTADVVIADLTDANPNVFYELGIRHARRSGTILIAEKGSIPPFDLKTEQIIGYDPRSPAKAIDDIASAIGACHADPLHQDSPVLTAMFPLEEPLVYSRWRQKDGRYRSPIDGYWIERVDRSHGKIRDIHFSFFDFRFRLGLLHPFAMKGLSFRADGTLHSTWETKYVRVKRNEAREIVVEYVYRAKRKDEREWRPGYGQCRFYVGDSGEFAVGGGFYFAGEEQPPRRRDYEMQRLDHRLLKELGVERLTFREDSLRKLVPKLTKRFGTGLVQVDSEFAPAVRARRQR